MSDFKMLDASRNSSIQDISNQPSILASILPQTVNVFEIGDVLTSKINPDIIVYVLKVERSTISSKMQIAYDFILIKKIFNGKIETLTTDSYALNKGFKKV